MKQKCMRCGKSTTSALACLHGPAAPVCEDCAREFRIAATVDQLRSAGGYCRCGAYLTGVAQFIRHIQRCGEYGR
jgi:hypothetical protein